MHLSLSVDKRGVDLGEERGFLQALVSAKRGSEEFWYDCV